MKIKFNYFIIFVLSMVIILGGCDKNKNKTPEKDDVILEHSHSFGAEWLKDEMHHWHKCGCGEIDTKVSHEWNEGVVTLDPTEDTKGTKLYTCTVCSQTKEEQINELPHTHKYETEWTKDETYHWHKCSCGEIDIKVAHSGGKVTETEKAVCEICGQSYGELIIPFKYNIYVIENEHALVNVATCAKPGENVVIDVTLDEGYYLYSIKVNDTYLTSKTFVMPTCDVLIEVVVLNGTESYQVSTKETKNGVLFTEVKFAKNGEEVIVRAVADEGYRLESLYANGVILPFRIDEYGYYSYTIMQKEDLIFDAEFKEVEKITDDYTFSLTSVNEDNPAISHWKATYTDSGIIFNVLVEDSKIVNTASLSVYNNDNVEFLICKSTNLSSMDEANVLDVSLTLLVDICSKKLREQIYLMIIVVLVSI